MSTLKTNNLQLLDASRNIAVSKIAEMNGGFSFRNKIIDGRFDFWYEGTSSAANGYGAETMWNNVNIGSKKTTSKQPLTAGVDLPAIEVPTAKFFTRTVVSSVVGSGNCVALTHKIEGVGTLAGKTATLSFYAKADSAKNIAVNLSQGFGAGGSTNVGSIGAQLVSLTSSWKRYSTQITIPSISTMTIGSGDYLQVAFWFDANASITTTAGLGQQSGTFDIACVQLEEGSVMTPFEELPIEISQQRVNRYFEQIKLVAGQASVYRGSTTTMEGSAIPFKVSKRAAPALVSYTIGTTAVAVDTVVQSEAITAIALALSSPEAVDVTVTFPEIAIGKGFRYIFWGVTKPTILNLDARL